MEGVWLEVDCQVCGAKEAEAVYERSFETAELDRAHMRLVLCSRCGFLYASPRPSPETMAEHYRSSPSASGAVWHAHGKGSRHERIAAYRSGFVARLREELPASGSVLDVGSSQGDMLCAYDLPEWRLVGLEPSALAAARARERGLEVVEASLESNDLPPASFDLVTCWSVLEHVWDVRSAVAELARLTKPGGHLVVYVPDSARPTAQISEFFSFEHLSHFTTGTLYRLVQDVGLHPLRLEHSEGPGLTLALRREDVASTAALPVPDDRDELVAALRRYGHERAAFEDGIRRRFEHLLADWREHSTRVALFGAGEHTRFLLDLVGLGEHLVAVLDSDPTKNGRRFLRWTVHPPEAAPDLGVDVIVISSRPFQEEMAAAAEPLALAHGIEIVRCYPEW